jgi:exopolysaccharide production protein ExoQ
LKLNAVKLLWTKIEPAIAVLFLLLTFDVALPGPVQKLVNIGSYGVVALLFAIHWKRILYVATKDKLLWVLVGLALFSVFWSPAPSSTLNSGRALVRSMMFGAYLATRYSPREQMRLFAWMTGLAAIASLFYGFAGPGIAAGLWRGIYTHKQYLGRMMTFGAATLFLTFLSSRKYRWLPLAGFLLALGLIFLSGSKTALVLYLLSLALLPLYQIIRYYYKTQVVLYALSLLVGSATALFMLGNWQTIVVDYLGKRPDLTGRQEVWELAIHKALERPWFGYGYNGFWASAESDFVIRNSWASYVLETKNAGSFHAHSGFIDLFLWLGVVGLALFAIHYFSVLTRIITLLRTTKAIAYFWMLQAVLIMLLYNTTEVILILSQGNQLWLAYVAIAFSSSLQLERMRRSPPLPAATPSQNIYQSTAN